VPQLRGLRGAVQLEGLDGLHYVRDPLCVSSSPETDRRQFRSEHTEIPIFACCIYLCMIFYLPAHLVRVVTPRSPHDNPPALLKFRVARCAGRPATGEGADQESLGHMEPGAFGVQVRVLFGMRACGLLTNTRGRCGSIFGASRTVPVIWHHLVTCGSAHTSRAIVLQIAPTC
jgi:hypothetical protein